MSDKLVKKFLKVLKIPVDLESLIYEYHEFNKLNYRDCERLFRINMQCMFGTDYHQRRRKHVRYIRKIQAFIDNKDYIKAIITGNAPGISNYSYFNSFSDKLLDEIERGILPCRNY
jgi:hypothetical protein